MLGPIDFDGQDGKLSPERIAQLVQAAVKAILQAPTPKVLVVFNDVVRRLEHAGIPPASAIDKLRQVAEQRQMVSLGYGSQVRNRLLEFERLAPDYDEPPRTITSRPKGNGHVTESLECDNNMPPDERLWMAPDPAYQDESGPDAGPSVHKAERDPTTPLLPGGLPMRKLWAMVGAAPLEDKPRKFTKAAVKTGKLVRVGRVASEDAVDALQLMADHHGLVDRLGQDLVQNIIIAGVDPHEASDEDQASCGRAEELGLREHGFEPLPYVRLVDVEGKAVPQRRFVIVDRIPVKEVTGLSGDGGVGKTVLGAQLCVAVSRRDVTDSDWVTHLVGERGPAIFYTAEEPWDEMHFRLDVIRERYGLGWSDLITDLHPFCPADHLDIDPCLAAWDRKRDRLVVTGTYYRLRRDALRIRPKLIYLENAADVFDVDETIRRQARASVWLLKRLAIEVECAVVLAYHPSVTGISSGTGRSGSTQWRNTFRAHAYLSTDKDEVRTLAFNKNNRGSLGAVSLTWQDGLLLPPLSASGVEIRAAEAKAEAAFLNCLDEIGRQGIRVVATPGRGYAPVQFEGMSAAQGVKKGALAAAMKRLLEAGKIRAVNQGTSYRPQMNLVRT
jgi:AAA domain